MTEKYLTIRTIRAIEHKTECVEKVPAYAMGDYMEIYCGHREGCCFWIKGIRYNHDIEAFQYLDGTFSGGWYGENQLSCLKRHEPHEPVAA